MTDNNQRRFWLEDEVQWAKRNSFIWGIGYGVVTTLLAVFTYEYYTGYPAWDYILRLLGDNGM